MYTLQLHVTTSDLTLELTQPRYAYYITLLIVVYTNVHQLPCWEPCVFYQATLLCYKLTVTLPESFSTHYLHKSSCGLFWLQVYLKPHHYITNSINHAFLSHQSLQGSFNWQNLTFSHTVPIPSQLQFDVSIFPIYGSFAKKWVLRVWIYIYTSNDRNDIYSLWPRYDIQSNSM